MESYASLLSQALWDPHHNQDPGSSPDRVRLAYARAISLGQKIGKIEDISFSSTT